MRNSGYSSSLLTDAGLTVPESNRADTPVQEQRDWFRDRIIFPIFNVRGDIVAFGGRVLSDFTPKYINSKETEVFKKGETLFGINLSKDEIRKKNDHNRLLITHHVIITNPDLAKLLQEGVCTINTLRELSQYLLDNRQACGERQEIP